MRACAMTIHEQVTVATFCTAASAAKPIHRLLSWHSISLQDPLLRAAATRALHGARRAGSRSFRLQQGDTRLPPPPLGLTWPQGDEHHPTATANPDLCGPKWDFVPCRS
jgi:hypothetical protein